MDIEGIEVDAIEDLSSNYLDEHKPIILFEIHNDYYIGDKNLNYLLSILKNKNYILREIDGNILGYINEKIKYSNIAILSYGRKGSTRCPNKLLRKFDKTTVVDIILKNLKNLKIVILEDMIKNLKKCQNHGVNFLQRSLNSVSIDYPIKDCLHFIKNINADYILLVNSCLPFLSLDTINNFLEFVKKIIINQLL